MKKILVIVFLLLVIRMFTFGAQPAIPIEKSKKIALTFDACMTTGMLKRIAAGSDQQLYNAEIVEFLKQEKIQATIFITGLWAEKYPETVKALAADPLFEIGNHSFSHRAFADSCFSLPALPQNEKEKDLQMSQEILTRLTGKTPVFFRFPGGCASAADQLLVRKKGLRVVRWSFASGDAFNSNTEAIVQNVLNLARSGSIVVFHLSGGRYAPKSAEALKMIVPELRKRGFEFVKVSALPQYK
ncbi:MAG: polysaccharide deacetylase family protein [Bacteroidia bacterium]|nr:polysaccharide deacetylase family protein [Bacteroidia bacterium]